MIDISNEQLIPLRDVPRHLPLRPRGPLHVSAVYRWILRGIRGVRLESIRIGGTAYTSLEALQRFGDRLSSPGAVGVNHEIRPNKSRQKQIAAAAKAVDEILAGRTGRQDQNKIHSGGVGRPT